MKGIAIAFQGLLAHDAKVKHTNAGRQFLSFGVLVGEDNAEKQWLSVLAWSEGLIDIVGYLKGGVEVYVEGKLRASIWNGNDGPRVSLTVSASEVMPMALIGKSKPKAAAKPRGESARSTTRSRSKLDPQRPIGSFADGTDLSQGDVLPI